jgi:hypothetical protein
MGEPTFTTLEAADFMGTEVDKVERVKKILDIQEPLSLKEYIAVLKYLGKEEDFHQEGIFITRESKANTMKIVLSEEQKLKWRR